MNKVLVTGLALGKDVGICDACNFDFEWVFKYPSVLIWADSILVSSTIWGMVSSAEWPPESREMAKSLQLIFNIARAEGIIEVVDPTETISPALKDSIFTQAEKDRALLAKVFPGHIALGDDEKVPGQLFVDGHEYCMPYIYTIYASLALARAWDTHCLFNNYVFNYCRYKFGLSLLPKDVHTGSVESFHAVFNAHIPNSHILPEYVLTSKEICSECAREQSCSDKYLSELEANLKKLLQWRDYDEIHQVKAVVSDIVEKRRKSAGVIDPAEVLHDFRSREQELRRKVKLVFPKIQRWANIATVLSLPVALAGALSGAPLIELPALGLAGLSQTGNALMGVLSSRYSWIGFLSRETQLYREV